MYYVHGRMAVADRHYANHFSRGGSSLSLTGAGVVYDAAKMTSSLITLGTGFRSAEAYPFKDFLGFRVSL